MKNYLLGFFAEFDYPKDAADTLESAYDRICESPVCATILTEILNSYNEKLAISADDLMPKCVKMASETGIHEHTVKLLVHICLSKRLRTYYAEKNLPDSLFVAAMNDLKYKLIECHIVKGVWGTFVADGNWFSRWYDLTRFAFDRLQFETIKFCKTYEKNGVSLTRDSKVINVHIPRTGTPLDHGEIAESYRKAAEFYKELLDGEPVVFVCSSWLLFPEHQNILHERSNIRKFMADYDIIESHLYPEVHCAAYWRIFDCPVEVAVDDAPEDTFLQRAYKTYLQGGGKLGYGYGVYVY